MGDDEQTRLWRDPSQLAYHQRQFEQPYESTRAFARFLEELGLSGGEALDVGCGAGANISYLSQAIPGFRWTGIDLAGELLFPMGRRELAARGVEATLVDGDMYELETLFPGRRFDLVISMQTLSWLPRWEAAVEQMMAVGNGWLVVSSLFTEFEAEVKTEAFDLTTPGLPPYHVNVYALSRFRAFCDERGWLEFRARDFEIPIDLPSAGPGLGTYTRMMADGRRLQFTGPVYLPWKFLAVQNSAAGRRSPRS